MFCNFVLRLSIGDDVVTSKERVAVASVKLVLLIIAATTPVKDSPVLSVMQLYHLQ